LNIDLLPLKVPEDSRKLRVLISGHLPPPVGGIATFYEFLLGSSLPERVDLQFVQTSSQKRTLSRSGQAPTSNLISALRDCGRFTRAVLIHRPHISHIATDFGLSFIKHSIRVGVARLLGSRVLLHPHCSILALYTERPKVVAMVISSNYPFDGWNCSAIERMEPITLHCTCLPGILPS
jgi:hypothetical protein